MPVEVQAVFRSSEDIQQAGQDRPIAPVETKTPAEWEAHNAAISQVATAPPINEAGETIYDVMNREAENPDSFQQAVASYGSTQAAVNEITSIPPLTTTALRQMEDQAPGSAAKANQMEAQGIYEVPANMIVVQDTDGNLFLRRAEGTIPEGFTIFTYGGLSPQPTPDAGDLGIPLPFTDKSIPLPDNALGELLGLGIMAAPTAVGMMGEAAQRGFQAAHVPEGFTGQLSPVGQGLMNTVNFIDTATDWIPGVQQAQDLAQAAGDWWTSNIVSEAPLGGVSFIEWQRQNPDQVTFALENGYNGFSGEAAVWELYQSERNLAQRFFDTLMTDPFNIVAFGAPASTIARSGLRGLSREASQEAAEQGIRRTAETMARQATGRVPQNIDQITDEVIQEAYNQARQRGVLRVVDDAARTGQQIVNIPDQVLNEIVDQVIRGITPVGRAIGNTRLGDMFRRKDETSYKNVVEVAR